MANFRFPKKVFVEFNIDERALDHDDTSLLGESISYILGGRDVWSDLVVSLYDDETDAILGGHIISKLTNALDDALYFDKIFTK